jgi:predicted dehydrogenase
MVTLHFKSGALGHVTGSWAHSGPFRTQFEICGDAGMIEHDSANSASFSVRFREPESAGVPTVAIPESPLFPDDDPYYKELRHFVDIVDGKAEPLVTANDARAAVAIAEAALQSIATGKPVSIG